MRRRLVHSTLAVVLVVVAVFGLSVAVVEMRSIEDSARSAVRSEALRLASAAESRLLAHEAVTQRTLSSQVTGDRHVVRVRIGGRPPLRWGRPVRGEAVEARETSARGRVEVTVRYPRSEVSGEIGRMV